MYHQIFRIISLLLVAFLLTACEKKPATVAEISETFWQAVIADAPDDVVAYSTLQSAEGYNNFGRQWQGLTLSLGQIVINGDAAQVETQIAKPDAQAAEILYFLTYLVKTDAVWRVDYKRTADAVNVSGAVVDFVGQFTSLGKNIQRQVEASSENVARQLSDFVDQLEQVGGEYRNRADKAVDEAAARMGRLLDEFASSLEEAMKEMEDSADTDASRSQMKESVESIQSSSEALKNPGIESIAGTAKQLITVMEGLARLSDQQLQHYRQRWEQLAEEFRVELLNLLTLFAGVVEQPQEETPQ